MGRFAFRAHYWGALLVVVLMGDIDAPAADTLASRLARIRYTNDLIIDLIDATGLDVAAVGVLVSAKRRVENAGWGFALVAQEDGPCRQAMKKAGQLETLAPFATRQAARTALTA